MTAVAFDTLRFAKRLQEAGFSATQAEALALAEAEILEANLSSKQDLKDLETRLLGEIERLRRDMNEMKTGLKRDMEELETGLRRDMNEMKTGLKRDMEELETGLRRDMKDLEYRMTIKLGSLMVIAVGSMAALVKLL